MKTLWVTLSLLCSGCAAVTADPWDWLDDPEEQKWVEVVANGYGREIRFSIPDRLSPGGQRTRFWPEIPKGESRQVAPLRVPHLRTGYATFGRYSWDWVWGGYFKKSEFDFYLSAGVILSDYDDLLQISVSERIQRFIDYRTDRYTDSGEMSPTGEYFFENLIITEFETQPGLSWVRKNNPVVTESFMDFTIPITNQHILEFSFFVRDKRFGWKDDPEWNARRWALVEQIMNTVRITPDPYQEASETGATMEDR